MELGYKFGKLTVLNCDSTRNRQTFWKCQCDCGNIRIMSTGEINRGRSPVPSCGCYRPPITDLSGKSFNNLTVIKIDSKKKSIPYWICQCTCGNVKTISEDSLKRNLTKSCGCLNTSGSELFMKKSKDRLLSKIEKMESDCWEWQGKLCPNGYGQMRLPGLKIQTAHRASWTIHNGQIPSNLYVLHKCDNKKCVNPDHLYIGTPQDNINDMIKRGNFPCGPNKKKGKVGEKNIKAKLDDEKVKYIKYLCKQDFKKAEIANFFHVSKSTIERIAKGDSWNHI